MISHARLKTAAAVLALAALGLVPLLEGPEGIESTLSIKDVPGLERSEEVVAAKIARKEAKLAGEFAAPKNPDGYAEYRTMIRTHPEGTRITQLQLEAIEEVKSRLLPPGGRDAGLWDWDWLGPGNIGGRLRAILLHPTDPFTMWIGTAGGGIWKTTNRGDSWFPLDDFLPSLAITSLVMDPNDTDRMYASTGEGYARNGIPGAGILMSTDGGDSWEQLPGTDVPQLWFVNYMVHHPTDSGTLLASAQEAGRFWGDGRVLRTTNYGASWDTTLYVPESAYDIAIDPDDPDIVLMSHYQGVFRSDDNGRAGTWTVISTGGNGLPLNPGRTSFSFGVGNDVVYASCDTPEPGGAPRGEIWCSLDNGITWELRDDQAHALKGQGYYNNVIWLEPGSETRIMVGGIDVWKSYNGGVDMLQVSEWDEYHTGQSAHADHHAIVPAINYNAGSETIYFGNDGGIQRNVVGFDVELRYGWDNLANGLGITQFYHADVTPDGEVILGGTQDNDDLRFNRVNGPNGWYQATTGDGTFCAINPLTPTTMYTCYPHLLVEKSINGGGTYNFSHDGIIDASDGSLSLFMSPLVIDKVAPYQLYAGGRSIWRTSNHAEDWHEWLEPRAGDPLCSAIGVSPTSGSTLIWVGYDDGQIWSGGVNGADWVQVDSGVPNDFITDIEISPHDDATVLVSLSGYAPERIWLTTNGGQTWSPVDGSGAHTLPPVHVTCVSFHPIDQNWIYAGTDIGLFASEDRGSTWNVTPALGDGEGPVFTEIADLIWHSYSTLVAVTHGRGMYECMPLPVVWVDKDNTGEEDGTHIHPWDTFTEGYDAVGHGSDLIIKEGDYDEGPQLIEKRIEVLGSEGTVVIR